MSSSENLLDISSKRLGIRLELQLPGDVVDLLKGQVSTVLD